MERNRSDQKKRRRPPSGAAVQRTELTEALYRALFEEWAERGFAAVSLERVAARAGAGKAAIYRRWSSRVEFAGDAVMTLGTRTVTATDEGALEKDVLAFLKQLRAVLRHPLARRILPDLHAESARSSELRAVHARVALARRAQVDTLIERAIARGELDARIDRSLALDLLPAPLYWRMVVTGQTVSRQQLELQVAAIVAGLVALCGPIEGG
jgi:AcrR family transcriptional regulator